MVNTECKAEIQAEFFQATANRLARIVLEQMIEEDQVSFRARASVRTLRRTAMNSNDTAATGALTRLQAAGVIEELFQGPVLLLEQEELQTTLKRLRPQEETSVTP